MEFTNILLISSAVFFLIILVKLSKKVIYFLSVLSLGTIALFFVTGCSSPSNFSSSDLQLVEDNTLTRINDLPFLPNSRIDIEKSLIMGEGKSWTGQLLIEVDENKRDVFNFYVKNLEDFDWKEQTTIRGNTSILTYLGEENRVAIISIAERGLFNQSSVLITVSPFTEAFEEKVGEYINEQYLAD